MGVFWHPLKFIADYAACGIYLATRDLGPGTFTRDFLFADTFSDFPWRSHFFSPSSPRVCSRASSTFQRTRRIYASPRAGQFTPRQINMVATISLLISDTTALFPIPRRRERATVFFNLPMQKPNRSEIPSREIRESLIFSTDARLSIYSRRSSCNKIINLIALINQVFRDTRSRDAKGSRADLGEVRVTKYHLPWNYNSFYG